MFLGNSREVDKEFDVIALKFEDAVFEIANRGVPSFISFDYTIGYDLARWLVTSSIDGLFDFPKDFTFDVHNGNMLEKNTIEALLNNYIHFKVPLLLDNRF
jgi:hypothetical protein